MKVKILISLITSILSVAMLIQTPICPAASLYANDSVEHNGVRALAMEKNQLWLRMVV